jgi:ParB family transcriptional regulator, chromosome partitioning protein
MMTKKKGLGRGLEALLGANDEPAAAPSDGVPHVLPVDALQPGKYQPRTRMDEGALAELAESIKAQGVMQPVLVRAIGAGKYEIIAGERRVRAAALAGLSDVPVLVRDVPDESAAAMALIENIQREDLNPLEEAQGVQRLISEFHLTHEDAAKAIGRSRSATSNLLRLLNLVRPVQVMLMAGDLDMGHARALLAVDGATQITLANQIVGKGMTVRDAERLVARVGANFALSPSKASRASGNGEGSKDISRLETELSDRLAAKVTIKMRAKSRGQLMIDFASFDQLDGVLAIIRGGA